MPTVRRRSIALVVLGLMCVAGAPLVAMDVVGVRTSSSSPEPGLTYVSTTAHGGGGSPWLGVALGTVGLVLVTAGALVRRRSRPA